MPPTKQQIGETDIHAMAQRLTTIEGQVETIGKEVSEIGENVVKMTDALIGNKFSKGGLVAVVEAHKQEIERLKELHESQAKTLSASIKSVDDKNEKRWNSLKYWVMGLAAGTGGFVWNLIQKFFEI